LNIALSFFVGIYLFVVSFVFFVPLDAVVNLAGDISGTKTIEAYTLEKQNGSSTLIVYNGTDVAEVESYSLFAFLFLNGAVLSDISPKGLAASFMPVSIDSCYLFYPFWSPLSPSFWFSGDFGSGSGSIDFSSGVMKIKLTPTEDFKNGYGYILSKGRAEEDSFIFEYKL